MNSIQQFNNIFQNSKVALKLRFADPLELSPSTTVPDPVDSVQLARNLAQTDLNSEVDPILAEGCDTLAQSKATQTEINVASIAT